MRLNWHCAVELQRVPQQIADIPIVVGLDLERGRGLHRRRDGRSEARAGLVEVPEKNRRLV